MASTLTDQVPSISEITNAVALDVLSKQVNVDWVDKLCTRCHLELKETINGMTESLSVFADKVTRVAREVMGYIYYLSGSLANPDANRDRLCRILQPSHLKHLKIPMPAT
jgi:hypothetical protein